MHADRDAVVLEKPFMSASWCLVTPMTVLSLIERSSEWRLKYRHPRECHKEKLSKSGFPSLPCLSDGTRMNSLKFSIEL